MMSVGGLRWIYFIFMRLLRSSADICLPPTIFQRPLAVWHERWPTTLSHLRLVRIVSACRRNIEKLQDITQGSNSAASVDVAVAMAAVYPNSNNNTWTRRV